MNEYPEPQSPLIIRYHRLLDAFSKSDDERDFFLDRVEGAIIFLDLDKPETELNAALSELEKGANRYVLIPKLTYYESKKLMEGFVNEKVYDIDTKEKLLDIISSKEARENFLEFIYDHLTELDKWQQFYRERFKIRIIEWLCRHSFSFVFEEDIDLPKNLVEKIKMHLFDTKVPKDVNQGRDVLDQKAHSYRSAESYITKARRGRPPKAAPKVETEPQFTADIYKTCPSTLRPYLYLPDYNPDGVSFSTRLNSQEAMANLKGLQQPKVNSRLEVLSQRLESLRHLSGKLVDIPGFDSNTERRVIETLKLTPQIIAPDENRVSKIFGGSVAEVPKKRGRPSKDTQKDKLSANSEKVIRKSKQVSPIKLKKG